MTKRFSKTTALTCAALCIGLGLTAGAANAADTAVKSVRIAQERLTDLGYYAGPIDGHMGDVTKDAVRDFQSRNGLEVTGALTGTTYQLLKEQDMASARGYYGAGYNGYYGYTAANGYYGNGYAPAAYYGYKTAYNGYANSAYTNTLYNYAPVAYNAPAYNGYWNGVQTQALPIRFGQLAVNDDTRNGAHNYSVTLNGQSVLMASNQPQALKVSHTYRLNNEDAVIFTAYDGTSSCSYKSYLLTVRDNGTYVAPQQIGNCSGQYQARVESNMLYISFGNPDYNGGYASLDTWRYSDSELSRL